MGIDDFVRSEHKAIEDDGGEHMQIKKKREGGIEDAIRNDHTRIMNTWE